MSLETPDHILGNTTSLEIKFLRAAKLGTKATARVQILCLLESIVHFKVELLCGKRVFANGTMTKLLQGKQIFDIPLPTEQTIVVQSDETKEEAIEPPPLSDITSERFPFIEGENLSQETKSALQTAIWWVTHHTNQVTKRATTFNGTIMNTARITRVSNLEMCSA